MIRTTTSNVQNRYVSIIADETSNCGHCAQLSFVVPFLDRKKNEFIGLQRLHFIDAQSIFNCLKDIIARIVLKWDSIITICFDGAASMAECSNGIYAKT